MPAFLSSPLVQVNNTINNKALSIELLLLTIHLSSTPAEWEPQRYFAILCISLGILNHCKKNTLTKCAAVHIIVTMPTNRHTHTYARTHPLILSKLQHGTHQKKEKNHNGIKQMLQEKWKYVCFSFRFFLSSSFLPVFFCSCSSKWKQLNSRQCNANAMIEACCKKQQHHKTLEVNHIAHYGIFRHVQPNRPP